MRAGLNGDGLRQACRQRLGGFVRRLHAEHELEVLGTRVVPGEPAFRLEEHRVDGLRLELVVERQRRRIGRRKLGADPLAIDGRLGIGRPGWVASGAQIRPSVF